MTNNEWRDELKKIVVDKISVRPDLGKEEAKGQRQKTDEQMTKMLWMLMTGFDENDLQFEHSKAINQLLSMQRKACLQDMLNRGKIEQVVDTLLEEE